ncbi:MAG TPA: type II secretion system F family protein [Dehalococcoidia bacterium]|nr:type II secretion system F family protein [Dehalococcoidia bacterium]
MNYTYLGYTEDKHIVKGRISAASEEAAVDMLTSTGYRVASLKPVAAFLPDVGRFFQGKVKLAEMATFSRQLALLIESGVGIVQSLELLQSQVGDKSLRGVLVEVVADLRGGKSLAAALAKHPQVFSTIYCKMVGVGEQTGGLETVLRSLADYAERQSGAMNKLKTALTYPAIVFGLAILVVAMLVTVVLPPIVGLFTSLGGELPLPTRMLLAGVGFLTNYGLHLLVVVMGLGIAALMYSKSPTGRYHRDMLLMRLPVIGRLCLTTELARCCRSISLLFRAGLPLPEIMTLTAQASGNRVVTRALSDVGQDMLKGEGLAGPMRKRSVFLPLMVEMTKVGEETGNLDGTLMTVAENYEVDADARIQRLLSLIEPTMTIGMGLVVGFIALSIFMPIYSSLSLVG